MHKYKLETDSKLFKIQTKNIFEQKLRNLHTKLARRTNMNTKLIF